MVNSQSTVGGRLYINFIIFRTLLYFKISINIKTLIFGVLPKLVDRGGWRAKR